MGLLLLRGFLFEAAVRFSLKTVWFVAGAFVLLAAEFSLFTLSVSEGELRRRLRADVAAGKREADVIERAVSYLPFFERTEGRRISTDGRTPDECAEEIAAILCGKE